MTLFQFSVDENENFFKNRSTFPAENVICLFSLSNTV